MTEPKKVPIPPIEPKQQLYQSIPFWSSILIILDKKIQQLCEEHGYGIIGLKIEIVNGKIVRIVWNDEISDKHFAEVNEKRPR